MTPHWGNMYVSLAFLPATPSSPSQTLEGLFELTQRPSRALDLYVASGTTEKQAHCQARRFQDTADAHLD